MNAPNAALDRLRALQPDAQKKADPGFPVQASVADWRRLLGQARGQAARSHTWAHDVTELQAENAHPRAELDRFESAGCTATSVERDEGALEQQAVAERAPDALNDEVLERAAPGGTVGGSGPPPRSSAVPAPVKPGSRPAQERQALGLPDYR